MEHTKNTVLVTGATGTVGREVIKGLLTTDARIRAAVHTKDVADTFRVETVNMDYTKPESVLAAMKGIDTLFLLTPFTNNMVELTKIMVEAAKKGHVSYIVKLSVMGAEVLPGITLSRWHAETEYMIQASGISYAFLRPNAFMQNFVNYMASSIKNEGKFYVPAGEGKVSFVDVRDIGAVAARVLTDRQYERGAYAITGREALTYGQAAEIMSKVLGKKIEYVNVSDEQASAGMKALGMPEWMINAMLELYCVTRAGNMAVLSPTVEKITGRKPIPFEGFVSDNRKAWMT